MIESLPVEAESDKVVKNAMMKFADSFFEYAVHRNNKSFVQWRTRNIELILGGESVTATAFARWLFKMDQNVSIYQSPVHKCTINIQKMISFLTAKIDHASITLQFFFKEFQVYF